MLPIGLGAQSKATAKTPWGHPDLQGLWNVATMTPLERPDESKGRLTLTEAEVRKLESANASRRAQRARPSDGNRQAPPVGGDGSTGAAGNVGGYNNFWVDPGDTYNKVDGQYRTSMIVDPPDGRIPPTLPEAMKRNAARLRAVPTSDAPENVETRAPGAYDNPEQRPLGERCILGFGSTSGPPMLSVLYNNFKQIVQTPTHVMILVEMVHDARIIPFKTTHAPDNIRKWMGDSIARWEGDTLVVETRNIRPEAAYRNASENLVVTERFTPVDENTLSWEVRFEDPATWTAPWAFEMPLKRSADAAPFEYACHEGNLGLANILSAARATDGEREGN
jgi:hypothetical protein